MHALFMQINVRIIYGLYLGYIQELFGKMFVVRPCFDIRLSHHAKRRHGL